MNSVNELGCFGLFFRTKIKKVIQSTTNEGNERFFR